jgi:hypothetical protein
MKRASYKSGIEWVAFNDEPNVNDLEFVSQLVSVLLLADLFETHPEKVAIDVIFTRNKSASGKKEAK